ncbi:MAG TPA: hypothetical protein VGP26_09020 [Actinophytocola sp.]|jgi:hypothetical protein|nr:hypothetical protein [Actinophytocola sp.]
MSKQQQIDRREVPGTTPPAREASRTVVVPVAVPVAPAAATVERQAEDHLIRGYN